MHCIAWRTRTGDTSATWQSVTNQPRTARAALDLAVETLTDNGYEPRPDDGRVIMANCPFHALAQAQTQLVCQMNHALIDGLTDALGPHRPVAELDPAPGRCCVVLRDPRGLSGGGRAAKSPVRQGLPRPPR